jgi:hypothetical protein
MEAVVVVVLRWCPAVAKVVLVVRVVVEVPNQKVEMVGLVIIKFMFYLLCLFLLECLEDKEVVAQLEMVVVHSPAPGRAELVLLELLLLNRVWETGTEVTELQVHPEQTLEVVLMAGMQAPVVKVATVVEQQGFV